MARRRRTPDSVWLMRPISAVCCALLVFGCLASACSFGSADDPTTTQVVTVPALITLTEATTTTTEPPLSICDAVDSFPEVMPERVVSGLPDASSVPFDEFTLLAGAFTAMRFDASGDPVLVMIRGALPPRQFTEPSEVVEILDGVPSLVGPIGDGFWAAAWAIPPGDRCDLYSLIFYPPISPEEALAVAGSVR